MRFLRIASLLRLCRVFLRRPRRPRRQRLPRLPACTGSCCAPTSRRRRPSTARPRLPGTRCPARSPISSSSHEQRVPRQRHRLQRRDTPDTRLGADLTLPWISGARRALRSRPRRSRSDTTPWSAPFRFDVTPPAPPSPLPSYPGVLRWTPTEGADGYQVWLIDAARRSSSRTNVLDEREFYTFHQSPKWTGTVRWRVRAVRGDSVQRSASTACRSRRPEPGATSTARRTPRSGRADPADRNCLGRLLGRVASSPAHEMSPPSCGRGIRRRTAPP